MNVVFDNHLQAELQSLSPGSLQASVSGLLDLVLELERVTSEEIRQPLVAASGGAITDLSQLLLSDDRRYRDILMHLRSRRLARAS